MDLATLVAPCGTSLRLKARGSDAQESVTALAGLVASWLNGVDVDFDRTTKARPGLGCMTGRGMAGAETSGVFTMATKQIYITEFDFERLKSLLEQSRNAGLDQYLDTLRAELKRAAVVGPRDIPPDVITMNSTVSLVDTSTLENDEYTLVFPRDADIDAGRISVMAPLGTAMLGYRAGDIFEWDVPMGRKRWRVARVIYQPEAAGHHHL